ncbi:YdcF family protein [Spongorhabdus nitratireducens]
MITILKSLVFPPGIQILLLLIALLAYGRYRTVSLVLVFLSFTSLYLLSVPAVSDRLMRSLEQYEVATPEEMKQAQAIVVVGSGVEVGTDDAGVQHATLSPRALKRVHYAARLQHMLGLPLVTSGGGATAGQKVKEADVMAEILAQDFDTAVSWKENNSRTTWENAKFTHDMLVDAGIKKIVLVTNAFHMTRAVLSFQQAGFEVYPAPLMPVSCSWPCPGYRQWLPNAKSLSHSYDVMHEYVGLLWYRLKSEML